MLNQLGQGVYSGIKYLPKQIMMHLVYFIALWLNAFPRKQNLSLNLLPRGIVTQRSISLDGKCNVIFGSYVQTTTDMLVTDNHKPRTHGYIAIRPSGNWQGSLKYFNLETRKVVIRRIATVIPMPDRVVKRLNAWGLNNKKEVWETKLLELRNRNKKS